AATARFIHLRFFAGRMSIDEATKKFPEEAGISRYGQPEEIAELLVFMVSPAARWMTGTSVRMDGGEIKESELCENLVDSDRQQSCSKHSPLLGLLQERDQPQIM